MTQRTRPSRLVATVTAVVLALSGLVIVLAAPADAATRAFTPVFTTNTTGDVMIRGNTLETCQLNAVNAGGTTTCATTQAGGSQQNNNYFMGFVDTDGTTGVGASTFNSSTATVSIPAGATVLYAGLSWGAVTGAGSLTGYPALTGVAAPNAGLRGTASFQAPGASTYTTVTSTTTDTNSTNFQAYVDVTTAVQTAGSGVYTVGNVQAGTGAGNYAGWSLAVAFSDPTMPTRNLTVFTGYNSVGSATSPIDIPISGFTTPATGPVRTSVGVVVYEGDKGSAGDGLSIGGTSLFNSLNPVNDTFNSSVTDLNVAVTARNPSYTNTLGFDVDRFDATGALANGATSTTVHLTTSGDTYYPGMITFASDLFGSALTASKTVTDVNGGNVSRNDVLSYSVTVTNGGADGAAAAVLTDAVPVGTTYVAGSLKVGGAAVTDASGDDTGDASSGNLTARLGTGATATVGGLLSPAGTSVVTFRVTVNSTVVDAALISNTALVSSNAQTTGSGTAGGSNTVTSAAVVPPSFTAAITLTATGEVGAAYSSGLTVNAGTGTAPYLWTISAGALPAGLTINSSTGLVTGTPTAAGSSTFTVLVTDVNNRTTSRAQTIAVTAGPVVTFVPPVGEAGVAYSAQPTVAGGTGPYTWAIGAGTLPAGLTIDPSTGLISGTPTTAGPVTFTVSLTDSNSVSAGKAVTVTIAARPALTFGAPPAAELGAAFTDQLTFTGGVGPYTWSLSGGSLPAGLTLAGSTGLLSGTPTTVGSSTFTVSLVDEFGVGDTRQATILVTRASTSVAVAAAASVTFGSTVVLTATLAPTTAAGTVTFTDVPTTGPLSGTTVSLGTGTITSGTATLSVVLSSFGVHAVTASYAGDSHDAPAVSSVRTVTVFAYAGQLIVGEFRESGPAGNDDDYVELFNKGAAVPLAGLQITTTSGSVTTLPANAGILGTGRSYLIAGPDFSLGAVATPDLTSTLGTGGVQVIAPDTAATATDAVGPSSGLHVGTPLPTLTGAPRAQYSWVRTERAGRPTDTRDNAADFQLVTRTVASMVGGLQPTLGSASPTGTADPFQQNAGLTSTLLDPSAAAGAAPNRAVAAGRLTVRRTITNNTGATVTSARVRIAAISEEFGAPQPGVATQPAAVADLRAVDPAAATEVVTVTGGAQVTVRDLGVDLPITTSLGGGLNSTLTVPLPGGTLAPGASVDVAFTFVIDTHGTFWLGYDVDAITSGALRAFGGGLPGASTSGVTAVSSAGGSGVMR